eukprot:6522436-Alexandrium_andersonii.AAC.1
MWDQAFRYAATAPWAVCVATRVSALSRSPHRVPPECCRPLISPGDASDAPEMPVGVGLCVRTRKWCSLCEARFSSALAHRDRHSAMSPQLPRSQRACSPPESHPQLGPDVAPSARRRRQMVSARGKCQRFPWEGMHAGACRRCTSDGSQGVRQEREQGPPEFPCTFGPSSAPCRHSRPLAAGACGTPWRRPSESRRWGGGIEAITVRSGRGPGGGRPAQDPGASVALPQGRSSSGA